MASIEGGNFLANPHETPSHGRTAVLFQGQGGVAVGMGKELYDTYPIAREIYDTADDVLGYSIADISFHDPDNQLYQTRYGQLAILVNSHALYSTYEQQPFFQRPSYAAGLSLGELNAFVVSEAVTFPDMLRVVDARADAMQKACEENPGGMLMVNYKLGADGSFSEDHLAAFEQAARQLEDAEIPIEANISANNLVLAGSQAELALAKKILSQYTDRGIRSLDLNVSGPFHTPYMSSAVPEIMEAVESVDIQKARIPIIANTSAKLITHPEDIREEVIAHITNQVRWSETVKLLKSIGVADFIEIGAKPTISKMIKVAGQDLTSVTTPEGITVGHHLHPQAA